MRKDETLAREGYARMTVSRAGPFIRRRMRYIKQWQGALEIFARSLLALGVKMRKDETLAREGYAI